MKKYNIAVVGATGNVGRELIRILGERKFPIANIHALASSSSVGKMVSISTKQAISVEDLSEFSFEGIDIAFFCAGSEVSKKYVQDATDAGCIVIDKGSLFRTDKDVPLIIPEVNPDDIKLYKKKNIICSPNCTVTPLLMVLKPLHDVYGVTSATVTTFQSVSGTGKAAMDELYFQTKGIYEAGIVEEEKTKKKNVSTIYPKRIAFNCIPQCGDFDKNGYTSEETKLVNETHKILDKNIKISATCVRVPVFNCHALSVDIELKKDFNLEDAIYTIGSFKGVKIFDNPQKFEYMTQYDATQTDDVFVSRIRQDENNKNRIKMWIVCDNIRKGAALNGVQIAEKLIAKYI